MENVKTPFLCDEYKRIELQDKIGDGGRRKLPEIEQKLLFHRKALFIKNTAHTT